MKIKLLSILLISTASSAVFAEGVTTQQVPATDKNSFYQLTINQLNQTTDNGDQVALGEEWTKYLTVSGVMYADAKAGDLSYVTQGENAEKLSVTNAHLTLEATPNTWSQLTLVTNYSGASGTYGANPNDSDFTNTGISDNTVYVDQAYATFGDEARYPVFAQIGRQYLPFGQYNVNPVIKSLGQVLTEMNTTDVQVGFVVPEGLYGSAYGFQNAVSASGDSTSTDPYNGGAVLGFKKSNEEMKVDVGMGYLNNMSGVNSVADYINENNSGYGSSVAALAPYASFQTGPFGINVDYVTALSSFDKTALPYDTTSENGAKPSAADGRVSYAFNVQDVDQVLFVGYQVSAQASALNLPKKRYHVGYSVYPLKNVLVGLEVTRDTNYDGTNVVGDTADGEEYYRYNARIGIEF